MWWFLPYMNRPHAHVCPLPPEPPTSHLPPHLVPPDCHRAVERFVFWSSSVYLFFLFLLFLLVFLCKKSSPSPVSWSFCFVLSSKFYSLSSYVRGIDPFWVCFLHMRKWKWKSLSCVRWILQARILEWVAFPFSRGIFPTQGLNPGLPHFEQILYQLSHQGSPFCTWCKVKRSASFLCMGISHFPSTVHWRNCSFSIEWS